ncbi:MAG: NADPH:quinone oxidoreductase family protein [Polyangiaceae bacterium]
MSIPLPPGLRVVVKEFAETPDEALGVATSLSIEPMDPPDPTTLTSSDVIVRVHAAMVGWVDLLMTSGQYQHMPKPPYTPGLESAGVVVWRGPDAAEGTPALGARVIVDGFVSGPRSLGEYQRWGGFATYVVAPSFGVHPIPETLSFEQAAGLLGAYETAYHCLVTRGRLRAGETVLIHGAAGATGLAAVEIAKLLGATVIATGRSAEKLAIVREHGADHILDIHAPESPRGTRPFRDDVKAITRGAGVDVVYDGVGGEVSLESLRCVKFGARFLVVGWASTPFVARGRGQRGAPNANQLPTNLIMMKGLDVLGCPTAISTVMDPSSRPPRLEQILSWAREGKLRPHVSHRFPLERFKEAMLARWRSEVIGSCVVVPPDTPA